MSAVQNPEVKSAKKSELDTLPPSPTVVLNESQAAESKIVPPLAVITAVVTPHAIAAGIPTTRLSMK